MLSCKLYSSQWWWSGLRILLYNVNIVTNKDPAEIKLYYFVKSQQVVCSASVVQSTTSHDTAHENKEEQILNEWIHFNKWR